MTVSDRANVAATWVAIASAVVGGGLWIGAQGNEIANTASTVAKHDDKIVALGQDNAATREAVGTMKQDISDIKQAQKEILAEIRKR
jgi:hypothetical protein